MLAFRKRRLGSYIGIRLCVVGWRHPLGKTGRHRVGLVRSRPVISIRSIDRDEWTLTTPGRDGYPEPAVTEL